MKNKNLVLVQSKHKKWILDFIAKDLCSRQKCDLLYVPSRKMHIRKIKGWLYIPKATKLIMLHQDLFLHLDQKKKIPKNTEVIVFYTHSSSYNKNYERLGAATKIVVMSSQSREFLITNYQISKDKVQVLIGGVDTNRFYCTPREDQRTAIFVCDYKERKRPDLILRTVEENENWTFILHGKNWQGTPQLAKMELEKNFKFYDFSFSNSLELYNLSSVYVSLSDIEGGPLPAIEALICGNKVILTDTGFAKDLSTLSSEVQVLKSAPTSMEVTYALEKTMSYRVPDSTKMDYKKLFDYDDFLIQILKSPIEKVN